jgi:hypothetical protein
MARFTQLVSSHWRIPPPFFPLGAPAQELLPLSLAMARFTQLVGSNWRIPSPFFPLGAPAQGLLPLSLAMARFTDNGYAERSQ